MDATCASVPLPREDDSKGRDMTDSKQCSSCSDSECAAHQRRPNEAQADFDDRQALASRMCAIKHKIVVLSGKGGVGKSTVAANLAATLVAQGASVGLLDVDIHGPSIPKLLHLEGFPIHGNGTSLEPIKLKSGLRVMSIGFLLPSRDDAVIWRGPMKYKVIRQFLMDVEWGELDYLIVDCPPGTGDEPLAIIELIDRPDGAIVVTTPQQLAVQDVRRSIHFCQQLDLPVLGVIENMSGYVCPKCGSHAAIFGSGGGESMAESLGVPFLGVIPIDPQVVISGDEGKPFVQAEPDSEIAKAFARAVQPLLADKSEAAVEAASAAAPAGP